MEGAGVEEGREEEVEEVRALEEEGVCVEERRGERIRVQRREEMPR